MKSNSYLSQSNSLKYVQKFGPSLEKNVKNALGWESGRVVYYENESIKYDLQVDCCYPNVNNPEVFVSVTYCKPDKPGHSNENKLQLKLGELMLLKGKYPNIKAVLVIGGNKNTWLPYVLEAFKYFYDKVIYAWEENFEDEILKIKQDPSSIEIRHQDVWRKLYEEWQTIELYKGEPIDSYLRNDMWEHIKSIGCEGELPEDISNEIFKHCMTEAHKLSLRTRNKSGKEWTHYQREDWDKLWESRSYFNPAEAAIELLLKKYKLAYKGGLAKDEDVPSLIHHLNKVHDDIPVDNTKVGEDFILFSKKENKPVFIQSKSTGGGRDRHGKNIQNRTKEQLARSLFYRGTIQDGNIVLRPKDYIWIGILDGDWGVTKKTPLKYIHMLQWAGYDYLFAADSLVDEELNLTESDFIKKLLELECVTDQTELEERWRDWMASRGYQVD
ncbi:hypothetical protein [Anoxybacillus sp. FSL W8-1294]|uniref:hypothetical protein n=1 Tax=Anoxybacillus sp. FSL W8-1294 TaxID=2954655 RepID=UPI0030CBA79D